MMEHESARARLCQLLGFEQIEQEHELDIRGACEHCLEEARYLAGAHCPERPKIWPPIGKSAPWAIRALVRAGILHDLHSFHTELPEADDPPASSLLVDLIWAGGGHVAADPDAADDPAAAFAAATEAALFKAVDAGAIS